ncbi:DHA2 family efflux MFS transporter permease subunit [Brevibacillus porteri]|uniref:MFS transporter n=1 Tax=Brevibacillus porteri TaxID=2126350 RepID=A0ABX5FWB9_9BACL|nr:DHA2 family efflux MFS transporter permease subunit [Brevibacillus porteri]MED1797693.1 DHA2 family efflux MFS transporter permease subunit [Brevibacillus porteri]MED2130567.1 DHA2 family efflux MFS transporter permease subunit [Brevibacillus porteri]MED2745315.1 DHA2 family efflux MFS transporter permease subunit [Brevibacillus porteri]MED2812805.1 DHA2 family efflux MFS transporter permease subunit [Brevibacillus porteri]MED2895220.1 DHA2 family efflux MFS transporter permease subunit [Br
MAEAVAHREETSGNSGMWLSLVAILSGTFVAILNNSLINVALPAMVNIFGSTTETMQWVLTGYMLANAVMIPMSGSLSAKFGAKKIFVLSLSAFTFSSILCALAWSDSSLIAFRVVQGVSGGMIMPIGMSMIYMIVPREKIGMALGIFGIASMTAPALGPTLGGYLIEFLSWQFLFLVGVPFGIFAVIMSIVLLKETPKKPELKFDFLGAFLAIVGFGTLLLAFSKGQAEGWTSFFIVSLFFVAVMSLILFVWVELGKESPLLDLRLLKIPTFTISILTSGFVMMGMMGGIFLMPIFLQNIQGLTAMESGILLMPQSIAMAIMMPISGKLMDKYGIGPIGLIGLTIMSITTYELHTLSADSMHSWIDMILTIRGIGIGLCMMTLSTVGMNAVPRASVGDASPLSNVLRQVMSSFAIAILTVIMQARQNFHMASISDNLNTDMAMQFISGISGMYAQVGVDAASATGGASAILYGMMAKESLVQGIGDTFLVSVIPIVLSIPLLYFLHKKPKKTQQVPATEKATA